MRLKCSTLKECFSYMFDYRGDFMFKTEGWIGYTQKGQKYRLGVLSIFVFIYNILCNIMLFSFYLIAVI